MYVNILEILYLLWIITFNIPNLAWWFGWVHVTNFLTKFCLLFSFLIWLLNVVYLSWLFLTQKSKFFLM